MGQHTADLVRPVTSATEERDAPEEREVTSAAVIDVHGLRKTYGDVVAVADVDLRVEQGEVFAFLGPNGAGKTTTIDILTGVRSRTAGTVSVLGADPADDRRGWRNRIGVVPQTTAEYLDLTVREVVAHFASFYSDPLPVDEILDMVGLTAKARAMATTLSGGQKRRLDVAVGVVGRPELIFLDEPTTGLDPEARREAWELVRYFRQLGATTVLTTHYLDEAEALADRAGIIAGGRMRHTGTLADLGSAAGTSTVISFRDVGPLGGVLPSTLATVDPSPPPGMTVVRTDHPTEALARLIGWARSSGTAELPQLVVARPSLEDTYLRLVAAPTPTQPEVTP